MSWIVTCLDCPMYQTGGYCRHKKKDVGALQPACDYALTIDDKLFNPEDKTDTMHDMNTAKTDILPEAPQTKTDILPETQQTKTCRNCGRTLTLDHFYTNKGKPNSICKDCKKEEIRRNRKPKEAKTARRTTEQPLRIAVRETLTDQQMVDLLREHGWTVTCEKYEKVVL